MSTPAETQPLIPQLLAALDQSDPAAAARLRAELAGEDAAPKRPPTLLDELREEGFDAQELTVSEIPNGHEVPLVLGIALLELRDLTARVDALDRGEATPTSTAPIPATEPVSVPVSEPAPATEPVSEPVSVPVSEPAPADVLPAVEPPAHAGDPLGTPQAAPAPAPDGTVTRDSSGAVVPNVVPNEAGEDEAAR